jgi:hypothetical protein
MALFENAAINLGPLRTMVASAHPSNRAARPIMRSASL